ncbi:hypothetical protein DPMN_150599 [Dreissena polymorpha]|uniref:Uncharacterized protein n=1 Tax=Dreissena polymorpha TaxID=45954 RepID=A0A9D4FGS3_DREPO|nr:hypothetical protein DPMN_150599 [Dreissena polymorpha]
MKDEEDPLLELLREEEQTEQIHDLPQPKANQAAVEQRQPIDWPKTTDKRAWNDLDKELDAILTSTMQGPVDRKLKCMTTLVYTVAKERFGTKKTRASTRHTRRQVKKRDWASRSYETFSGESYRL